MKIYTLIGGVNGAGKSSLSGVLNAQRDDLGIIIDPDRIAKENGCGAVEAGKLAIRRIEDYLAKGINFTQETTLSGHRVLNTVQKAKDAGYQIHLFYVGIGSAEESLRRIRNRVEKGGHNIPASDVERRFSTRFDALLNILPYCDESSFFDNENGFIEVAQYRNGRILELGEYSPQWLRDLISRQEDLTKDLPMHGRESER